MREVNYEKLAKEDETLERAAERKRIENLPPPCDRDCTCIWCSPGPRMETS